MVAKTPNKRKSLAAGGVKIEGTPAKSPQANPKTPQTGKKEKANQSLVESGKTPKKNQQNSEGTPQKNGFTPGKKQRKNSGSEKTPAAPKTPNQPASPQKQQNSPGQKRKSSVSEGDEGGKKPKMFPGTAALNDSQTAKPSPKKEGKKKNKNKKTPQAPIPRGDKHRKTLFESVKEQIEKSGKESAIANLEKKITEMEKRKNPTKTTQKKLKQHQRVLKLVQEGDLNTLDARGKVVMPDKPAKVQEKDSESKKRRQRKNKGNKEVKKSEKVNESEEVNESDDVSEEASEGDSD